MKTKTARRWLARNIWNIAKAKIGYLLSERKSKDILKKEKYCRKIVE